jgi:hypothetical protein
MKIDIMELIEQHNDNNTTFLEALENALNDVYNGDPKEALIEATEYMIFYYEDLLSYLKKCKPVEIE